MPTSPAPTCDREPSSRRKPGVRGAAARRPPGTPAYAGVTTGGDTGFTLIELMVVVAIMALASAAVVLTLPDGNEQLRADAERFAGRVAAARDAAVVQARPMAVWVSPSAYGFARREQGAWRPLEDKPFATTSWRDGVVADTAGEQLRLTFDGTGMTAEPVAVNLTRRGRRAAVTVDAAGRVAIDG